MQHLRLLLSGFINRCHALTRYMHLHYSDVIISTMASQITNLMLVYSTVYSGADQRKHQSPASLTFVRGIHRWPVISPRRGLVTRKMFPFDDVIMYVADMTKMYPCRRCKQASATHAIYRAIQHIRWIKVFCLFVWNHVVIQPETTLKWPLLVILKSDFVNKTYSGFVTQDRVTHIYVSVVAGSSNGLSPVLRQAITWTSNNLCELNFHWFRSLFRKKNFSETLVKFLIMKTHLKYRPQNFVHFVSASVLRSEVSCNWSWFPCRWWIQSVAYWVTTISSHAGHGVIMHILLRPCHVNSPPYSAAYMRRLYLNQRWLFINHTPWDKLQ